MTLKERFEYIISRIIKHPSFKSGHERIDFGRGYIGYYISGTDTSYFGIKFGGADVTIADGEISQVQCPMKESGGFLLLDTWLARIEALIPSETTLCTQCKGEIKEAP